MDTRKQWYIATGLVIVALILATDPFTILEKAFRRPLPVQPENAVSRAARVVRETGRPAHEYLTAAFQDARVVFLGEFPQIADHAAFVADAIPALGSAGIRTIALEHLRSADQAEIDVLVGWEQAGNPPGAAGDDEAGDEEAVNDEAGDGSTGRADTRAGAGEAGAGEDGAGEFDAGAAEELLFRRDVTWGFQEYRDILQAVWELNRNHPESTMRIRGMSPARDPDMSAEEHEVRLEAHMAEQLQGIVKGSAPGGVLVYVSARRAIPRIPDLAFRTAAAGSASPAPRRLAVWAREELGVASRTILLHAPWPEETARYGLSYPAGGLLDHAVFSAAGANPELPWGFDVKDTTLGGVGIDPMGLRPETESATLGELTGGYIVVSRLSALRGATPIPGFIRTEWEANAVARYPGDIPDTATAEVINRYIARTSENLSRILESFRDVE